MVQLLFHPATTEEVKSSFDWYQEQVKGLGHDLCKNWMRHLIRLHRYPTLGLKWGNFIEDSF